MTAIIVIRQKDALHLVSDGLASGPVYLQHPKVFALPHLNAMIGIRGGVGHFSLISSLSAAAPTFDGVAGQLETLTRGFANVCEPLLRASDPDHPIGFELVFAGLSETRGLVVYFLTGKPQVGESYEIWELPWRITAIPGEQGIQEEIEDLVGNPDACDVRSVAHSVVDAARHRMNPALPQPQIGAFSQLTTLKVQEGTAVITTEILGRWPMPTAVRHSS